MKPTDRFKHLSQSAFDPSWMDHVDPSLGVLIVAQGLFMYFDEEMVRNIVTEIFKRFSKARLLFDFVGDSLIRKTQKGFHITPRYTSPKMAWGVGHDKIEAVLWSWHLGVASIKVSHYDIYVRGIRHFVVDRLFRKIPFVRNQQPGVVYIY